MSKLTPDERRIAERYGHLFANTGGNDPIELMERTGIDYFSNPVTAELQGSCFSQTVLLLKLERLGLLSPNGPPKETTACTGPRPGEGIYFASKTRHAPRWKALRAAGVRTVSSWIDEAGEGQTADYAELSARCLDEIHGAAAVLVYCEPGDLLKGALVEVGAALMVAPPYSA